MVTNEEAVSIIRNNGQKIVEKFRGELSTELARHEKRYFSDFYIQETDEFGELALLPKWRNIELESVEESSETYFFDFFLCADGKIYWRCSGDDKYEDINEDEDDVEWGEIIYSQLDWIDNDQDYDPKDRVGCIIEVGSWDYDEFNFYLGKLELPQESNAIVPDPPSSHRSTRDI